MRSASDTAGQPKRTKLARRFNLALGLVYVVTVAVTVPVVYWYTKEQVHQQANKELKLLVDVTKAIQSYVIKDVRPYMVEHNVFFSPTISGVAATSYVAGHLKAMQPDYYIKTASDNPLNPENRARYIERDLLNMFRGNRNLTVWQQEGEIQGKPYLVAASPKVSDNKGCLRCHSTPDAAPPDVREKYGKFSGYNYKLDEVVGVSLVGVPLGDVEQLVIERTAALLGVLTVLFGVLFVVINLLVRRLILRPIAEISARAREVSEGKLDTRVVMPRHDEIGELSRAFEQIRRSLVTAVRGAQA
jgi:protein-histidine pros-kinase